MKRLLIIHFMTKTFIVCMHIPHQSIHHVHFVGIGGIGMSGIAELLHNLGYLVKGSDITQNANTQRLEKLGIPVLMGHQADHVYHAQVVVVSSAISENNPEIISARDVL